MDTLVGKTYKAEAVIYSLILLHNKSQQAFGTSRNDYTDHKVCKAESF